MRIGWVFVLLCAVATAAPGPIPEEVAAMLLSPRADLRAFAEKLLKVRPEAFATEVRATADKHRADPKAWITELEKAAQDASGERKRRVERMLDALLGGQDAHVGVNAHVVAVPKALADRILTTKGPEAWDKWWGWIRADKKSEEFLTRALPGRDARLARVKAGKRISYVKDMQIDERGMVVDPVIATVEAGLELEWRPRLNKDRTAVRLETKAKLVRVKRPIAFVEVQRSNKKFRVQRPELTTYSHEQAVVLRVGGCAAYRFPLEPIEKEGHVALVLLRANVGGPLPFQPPPKAKAGAGG
ncbi:MAG: hypothetical protein ACYTGN_00060 [Planctomycetota bacterium]|jgi:hypothetical protein